MLINKDHLLSQLSDRPSDGWISITAVKAMIEDSTATLEDLREEAKRRGMRLYKYQPYVPLLRCRCGRKPAWYRSIGNHIKYACMCGKETEWCRSDKEARTQWNRMVK